MGTIQAMTQAGAAKAIGMDRAQLNRLIRDGKVRTTETLDGLSLVPAAEVRRLKAEDRRPGRPRK